MMVFVNVHTHFRMWTRIQNPQVTDPVPDPATVPDPCRSGSGSGSTTLLVMTLSVAISVILRASLTINALSHALLVPVLVRSALVRWNICIKQSLK
jgi:hypothetical protein